jgi:exonuclease SbcD
MIKILHFADAHIDMANYGRHDPQTGLPMRVMDFLASLDEIVDTAIAEKVNLVLFAGDAYRDRTPAPTFQREWGRRIMRLSRASIPTLLLVGNHDSSPALGRAHALESFDTLEVPYLRVVEKPEFLQPKDLFGLPLKVIAVPWISRSGLMAAMGPQPGEAAEVSTNLVERMIELVQIYLDEPNDEQIPVVLTAHCSIEGASYGGERIIMLSNDLVLPASLVKDSRLDYAALGHIHKAQDLNQNAHPPVVYPGSIERVDFGEAGDEKFFVIAHVERGKTRIEWRKLEHIRPFVDRTVQVNNEEDLTERLYAALPAAESLAGAIVRLVIEYPRDMEAAIDDASLREYASQAFEFQLTRRPQSEARIRIPGDQAIGSLSPEELLEKYWQSNHMVSNESEELSQLAKQVIHAVDLEASKLVPG